MSDMRAKFALLSVMVFIVGFVSATALAPSVTTAQVMDSTSFMVGHIEVQLTDAAGNVKHYQQTDNVVTDKGNECALRNLLGTLTTINPPAGALCTTPSTTKIFEFIAFGDDATGALVGQTDLIGAQTGIKVADTKQWDVGNEKAILKLQCIIPACILVAGDKVHETGIYDDVLGKGTGNMLARQGLNPITVSAGDTLNITWTIDTDNL